MYFNNFFTVACSPGEFWSGYVKKQLSLESDHYNNEYIPVCSACPAGKYQNKQGSIECYNCPENYSTSTIGSILETDCKGSKLMILNVNV